MDAATWIGIVAAPALLGTVIYFANDYIVKTDDKIKRLEGMIESVAKDGHEKLSTIKHQIEVVTRDDTRHIIHAEINTLKLLINKQHEKSEKKIADIKEIRSFTQRHENALAQVMLIFKSHNKRINEIANRLDKFER